MNAPIDVLIVALLLMLAALAIPLVLQRKHRCISTLEMSASRILFPFLSQAMSARALEVALRLARAENATLVPVFLARVPMSLPLETPLPQQCRLALPLQEVIEHRAAAFGVPVDARIERGRTYRHGLRQTIAHERFDWIVMAAAPNGGAGFGAEDVDWLLDHASGEVIVLRPSRDAQPTAAGFLAARDSSIRSRNPKTSLPVRLTLPAASSAPMPSASARAPSRAS